MIKLVGVLPKLSLLLVGFLVLAGALMTAIENNKVIRESLDDINTIAAKNDEDCWFLVGPKDDVYKAVDEKRKVYLNLPKKCIDGKVVRIHVPQDGVRRSFRQTERNSSNLEMANDTSTNPLRYWYGEDTSDGSTFKFAQDKYGSVFASLTDTTSHTVFELEVEGKNSKIAYTRTYSTDAFLPAQIIPKRDDRKLNIDPNGVYIEITDGVCESHGYMTLSNPEECIMATDALKRTVIWGRDGEYLNVVTGCSMRFSLTSSTLVLFNQQGFCDQGYKMDDWTFTRCQCSVWMPCLCRNSGPAPPSDDDNDMSSPNFEHLDFTFNVLNETERLHFLDTENGKIAILSVEEIKALFLYHDQDYSHLMTDADIFDMTHIKENQGFVLRAKSERTGREGGLMIWSNSTHAFGCWNPRDSASVGDFMDGDVLTLMDYCPLSFGRRIATSSEVTFSFSSNTTTEWALPADVIQFGQSGLVGESGEGMEIMYELEQPSPIWGVWSDSVNLPYTVMYEDIFSGNWTIQKDNCTGTETFPAAVFAKKWRIRWESTDMSRSGGLSSPSGGGGLHAQLIMQYIISGITGPSPSSVSSPTTLLTPTKVTQTSSTYTQVISGVCETHGHDTITLLQDCMKGATELGQSGFISSSSEHIDIVTGCSIRFSVSTGTTLFFNEPGNCDPTQNMDEYTYTGCECTVWMPCICRIPFSPTSAPIASQNLTVDPGTPASNTTVVSFADILEGTACICDGDELEKVYRFMNGELSLYPNAEIATSWDEGWREHQVTVDCASISFGEPLQMKIEPTPSPTVIPTLAPAIQTIGNIPDPGPANSGPSTDDITKEPTPNDDTPAPIPDVSTGTGDTDGVPDIPEGQASVCNGDTSQVYRFSNGKLHLYPDSQVASSWDKNWRNFKYIECTDLEIGDPMAMMSFSSTEIPEGATVYCNEDNSKMYRYEEGVLRHYESIAIADSWDENWRIGVLSVDCSDLTIGSPMEMSTEEYIIPDRKSVQCEDDPSKIFRYEGGTLYHYPDGIVARSWDENWRQFKVIDCTGLTFGDTLTMVSSYEQVTDGKTVQCNGDNTKLYRVVGGTLRHYSNVQVAYSWNQDWRNFIVIDCRFFSFGDPMEEYVNVPMVKRTVPVDQRYVEITSGSCEYNGHNSLTSAEECTAAAIDIGLTIMWGPYGGYRDVVTGCSTRFTISKQSLLHFNEPGVCDPNYNILDWAFTSCQCTIVMPCICKNSLFGKTPAVSLDNIEEGTSCRCQKDDGKIYRYMNQELHHYASVQIALSWNENWREFKVVDCDDVSIGSPMEINPIYEPTIPEGQSVQCEGNNEKLYRLAEDELRHYPSATIAESWNPNWRDIIRDVDCSTLTIGEPMELHPSKVEEQLPVGQTVQCKGGDGKLYRFMGNGDKDGDLRHYSSGTIASSWNPEWRSSIRNIDCDNLSVGEPLDLFEPTEVGPKPPEGPVLGIPDNKAIQCKGDTSTTYAWMRQELHSYPSKEIAESWGEDMDNFIVINCTDVPIGSPLPVQSEILPDLPDGHAVTCNDGSGRLYRLSEGLLRYYPTGAIASSWDPNWQRAARIDCWFLDHGPDMEVKPPPADDGPIPEGQSCTCIDNPAKIYRWMNGELHHYPSGTIAQSWNPQWRQIKIVDCTDLPIGWPMDIWVPTASPVAIPDFYSLSTLDIPEGQAVQCDVDTTSLFRFMFGQLRSYPNVFIANSWDPNYNDYIVVDCSELSFGPPMLLNSEVTSLASVVEGTTIQCDGDFGKLYRWTNFVLRLYPDVTVANTWNENWRDFILVDCSNLLFGPPMEPFTPFNVQSIQSSNICLIAENLALSIDDIESQDLCPTSQWALGYFEEQYYVIMDKFASQLDGSAPGQCHCLSACMTLEVTCEIECRQSMIGDSCKQACEAACQMCENNCIS